MFNISNRRYTGSKYKLLDWIESLIEDNCEGQVFFDVFAGTGVVSDRMKNHFSKVIMNDFLYSNEVIYRAFFENKNYRVDVVSDFAIRYNDLDVNKIRSNYISKNFGGKYFSVNDAKKIGYIRENLKRSKEILNGKEFNILLASLLYSIDRIANTVGHYDAYRKTTTIEDRFQYMLIDPEKTKAKFDIYREDANQLVKRIHADVAFIDPPYNSRQYSRFYHVLENITRWKKPKLNGTALKPKAENISDYCKSNAPLVFGDLISKIDVKYIVVTYNNTYNSKSSSSKNKITLKEIKHILSKRGETSVYEKKHRCFNAGKTEFNDHKELVFITKVGVENDKK